ncbi:MAG TPA: hypothetical protein VGH15_07860 [Caulobacteraceae bacterium]|jgi:hypothetical protein
MGARSWGLVAAAAMAIAGAAWAQAPVDLRVVDRDTGQVLPLWRHNGRLFVAGQPGDRYGLRVANHTAGRVLAVLSVDGVNIVTGQTASWGQGGYVLSPGQTIDLNGWRKSTTEVAAFTFSPLSQSYAARTGRPTDVGVIGIAVFEEKRQAPPPVLEWKPGEAANSPSRSLAAPAPPPPPPPPPMITGARRESAQSAEAKSGSAYGGLDRDEERLGTGHGEREWSFARRATFERASRWPQYTRQIEYDTYAHLVASGVIHPALEARRHPQPFPLEEGERGFVPDPPDEP